MVDSWNAAQLNEAVNNGSVGGGSSLPTVTASDNGKVLTVVEGAWNTAPVLNTYSATEQLVGKWVDGKDIYRKVVPAGEGGITSGSWVELANPVGIGTGVVDTIISMNGIITNAAGDEFFCVPDTRAMLDYTSSDRLLIKTTESWDNKPFVIMEYTKKTV